MPEPTKEELKTGAAFCTTSREDGGSMFDDVEKRRIWRALDIRLLPMISLLYLMSFL
jgi:hypothetical protein